MLATGSFDASVGIWRREDGAGEEKRMNVTGKGMGGVDFDSRDREIEIGAYGQEEEEEDEEEWKFAVVLDGHESEVKSVAWSAGGNFLATCGRDKSVWIWEELGGDEFETVAVMSEHEGDVKCVGWHPEEELVASASYDDEVRLWRDDGDDWGCCGVLRGHGGTVWGLAWEGVKWVVHGDGDGVAGEKKGEWVRRRGRSGPRLVTCSDDLSVRVWRRRPREKVVQSRYSIIRSGSNEEDWVEEARLPAVHRRGIYAVAWSRNGRVVSTGGDGAVVVYEERWRKIDTKEESPMDGTAPMDQEHENGILPDSADETTKSNESANHSRPQPANPQDDQTPQNPPPPTPISNDEAISSATEWVIVAQIESAHGVFEVNHVTWAPRPVVKREDVSESEGGREDLIVTTGDDGVVKVWELGV